MLPLNHPGETDDGSGLWFGVGLVVLVGGLGGWWWWTRRKAGV